MASKWQRVKATQLSFRNFHLMCKEDIHFSNQLNEAIKLSDEIYMELDMDDPSTLLGGMLYHEYERW